MIEDLKNIADKIDRLWHDIRRVRDELAEHPEDIDYIDDELFKASDALVTAEGHTRVAIGQLERFEDAKAEQQDENIQAAIALLESKGFVVGTKT